MNSNAVYKGDDTAAFGNNFIKITVKNPHKYPISKLEFVLNSGCGIKPREFTDETNFTREEIVLIVNFSSKETTNLNAINTANMIAYDMQDRQYTCPQTLVFYAQNGVIKRNGRICNKY